MLRLVALVGVLGGSCAAMAEPVRMTGDDIKRAMPGALLEIDTPLRISIPVKVGADGLMSAEAGALGLTLGATKDRGRWWTEGDTLAQHLERRGVSRRDFLAFCGNLCIVLGLGEAAAPRVARALQAIRRAGKKVPEEVAVVGFDDVPIARHLGLTTVQVRIAELGERALDRLVSVLSAGEDSGGQELHKPELVIRSTTDPKASTR